MTTEIYQSAQKTPDRNAIEIAPYHVYGFDGSNGLRRAALNRLRGYGLICDMNHH